MELKDPLIYSFIAGFTTIIGTVLVFYKEKWSRTHSMYLISFAAGVMLATAFIHIIPESIKLSQNAITTVLIGILVFYLIQNVMMIHPCHDESCEVHRLGVLSLMGLTFHSLLDGVAIVIGFEVSPQLGILTTLAVLLHELPEGIATTGILLFSGMERIKVLWYSILVAVATPIGALSSFFLLKNISTNILGILLALAAGSFIYISAADLIPETHKAQNKVNAGVLIAGALVLTFVGYVLE